MINKPGNNNPGQCEVRDGGVLQVRDHTQQDTGGEVNRADTLILHNDTVLELGSLEHKNIR